MPHLRLGRGAQRGRVRRSLQRRFVLSRAAQAGAAALRQPASDGYRGLGEKIVDQLVEKDMVRTPADLYKLSAEDFAGLERMAEKSGANLRAALDHSRQTTLERFIYALGIRNVGESTARDFARHFGDLPPLLEATEEACCRCPTSGRWWRAQSGSSSPRSTIAA
jgi:hypothetical protein